MVSLARGRQYRDDTRTQDLTSSDIRLIDWAVYIPTSITRPRVELGYPDVAQTANKQASRSFLSRHLFCERAIVIRPSIIDRKKMTSYRRKPHEIWGPTQMYLEFG